MSDTSVRIGDAADADYLTEAFANAVTDSEAGAILDSDEGGIPPLKQPEAGEKVMQPSGDT